MNHQENSTHTPTVPNLHEEFDRKLSTSSYQSNLSNPSKSDNQLKDSAHSTLKQQLNSYYSWSSSFSDNKELDVNEKKRQSSNRDSIFELTHGIAAKPKPYTEDELLDSRKRAVQRLIEKRREIQFEQLRKSELLKLENNLPRVRWRGGLKKKRVQEIDDNLDHSILQETILHEPDVLIKVLGNSNINGDNLEKTWNELLSGLEVDNTNHMKSPFKRFAENMKRQLLLSQSDMLHQNKIPRVRLDASISQPTAKSFLLKISEGMRGVAQDKIQRVQTEPRSLKNKEDLSELAESMSMEEKSSDPRKRDDSFTQFMESNESEMLNSGTFDLFYRKSRTKRSSGLLSKFVDKVNVAETGDTISHVAAEGGYYLIPGFYDPNTEAGAKLATDASFSKYFQRFADTVFVAGPLLEDIMNLAESSSVQFYDGTNNNLKTLSLKLEPHTLFMTKCDEEVDAQSLPKFCFPCWIDVAVHKINKSDSLSFNVSQVPQPNTLPSSKFSFHSGKVFTFILSNHTRKDYACCISVPRTFDFPSLGVRIQTEYCIAIISYFPFISYFYNLLEQFNAFGGFALNSPLSVQEDGFPIIPELRSLNDLALRLNRLLVPTYNGFIPEDANQSQDSDMAQHENQSPNDQSQTNSDEPRIFSCLNHHSPVSFNLIFNLAAHNKTRIDLSLKRDIFQTYYGMADMNPKLQPDYKYNNLYSPNEEQESEREREASYHLLLWSLPILLNCLSLDDILLVVGCILTEMKTIVVAADRTVMSACVIALMTLLEPLKWVSTVIVVLPDEYTEYLETPSPLIAGVESLPQAYQSSVEGVVIVRPEERKVSLHVNDVVVSHTLQLPRAHKLIPLLKPHVEAILKLTRKCKEGLRYAPMTSNIASHSPSTSHKPDEITSSDPILAGNLPVIEGVNYLPPLPIDVDIESDKGKVLLAAIKGFSQAMSSHIQTILNTSLQLSWETRRSKRHERHGKRSKTPQGASSRNQTVNTPTRKPLTSEASSTSLISDVTEGSVDNIALTETDSTETASSLPSVQKDAPVLPTRDIGEGGMKFIKRLQDTQLYSVYCYSKSSKKREEQEVDEVYDAYKLREHHEIVDEHNNEQKDSDVDAEGSLALGQFVQKQVHSHIRDENDEDSSTFKEDPLILMFQIILTGTVPMPQARLDSLNTLYNSSSTEAVEKKIFWCNGHVCGGLANTAFCTNICMLLWEQRVEQVRELMRIKEVIERQHHSELVLNTRVKVEITDSEGYVQHAKELAIKPRPVIVKHKRETESQFQLRKAEILGSTSSNALLAPPQIEVIDSSLSPIVGTASPDGVGISPREVIINTPEGVSPIRTVTQDERSVTSSGLEGSIRDGGDDLMSIELPELPLFDRSPKFTSNIPLPIEMVSYPSVNDDQSVYSMTDSIRQAKVESKYSTMYNNNNKKPTRTNSYLSISRSVVTPKPNERKKPSPRSSTAPTLPCDKRSSKTAANKAPSSIYALRVDSNGAPTRRLYARGSAPPVVLALASYYAKKQKRRLRQHTAFAAKLIESFLLTLVIRRRFRKKQKAAILIQKHIRGYLLRHVFYLKYLEFVKVYRCGKILKRMLFKKWLRRNAKDLISNYRTRKENEKRLEQKRILEQHRLLPLATISSSNLLNTESSLSDRTGYTEGGIAQKASMAHTFPPKSGAPQKDKKTSIFSNFMNRSSNVIEPEPSQLPVSAPGIASQLKTGFSTANTSSTASGRPPMPHRNEHADERSVSPAGRLSGNISDSTPSSVETTLLSRQVSREDDKGNSRSASPQNVPSQVGPVPLSLQGISISRQNSNSYFSIGHPEVRHEDIYRQEDDVEVIQDEEFMNQYIDEDDDTLKGPLRCLGSAAQDTLTPQQKAILIDMWALLCKGVEVIKHGRSGRPKLRYLYCDLDMTKLFWRANRLDYNNNYSPFGRHSTDSTDATFQSLAQMKPPRSTYGSRSSVFADEASETASNYGSVNGSVVGNSNPSKPTMKISNFFDLKKRDSERELFFRDIVQVCDDLSTVVMRRASAKSYVGSDNKTSVISIIVADRSLDFEIDKAYWDRIYHALQVLVNYYRVILPASQHASEGSSPLDYVAGTAYHHRSSNHRDIHRTNRRPIQSKTPVVISEAVKFNPNAGQRSGGVDTSAIGDNWTNAHSYLEIDSDADVDSD